MKTPNRKLKEYSKSEMIFGNLAIIAWIALGAISCGIIYFLAGFGYFALLSFLVFFEIGKHGCVTCYYCKTCTIGIGKLPEFFFRPEGIANVNWKAQKIFSFVFVLLSFVPISLVVFSIVQELLFYKAVLLASILGFSFYNGIIRRRTLLSPVKAVSDRRQ